MFGVVFTSTGLLGLYACGRFALEMIGIVPPTDNRDRSIGEYLLGILALLAIGGGHFACGTALLWTHRTTLDRERDQVVVRSGWMGCKCQRRRLSEFSSVAIFPAQQWHNSDRFDIALFNDEDSASLVVGYVTGSHDLAKAFAGEVSEFTGIAVKSS